MKAQRQALEDHRKNGADWQKTQREKHEKSIADQQKQFKAIADENAKWFEEFTAQAKEKLEFVKPKDGDEEWNTKLDEAEHFVAQSLAADPNDPRLSKDQRREIIERNTAVVNRAKAYSLLRLENNRLRKQMAEKDKVIAGYKTSEPVPGDGKGRAVIAAPISPRDEANQRLRKFAG